MGISASLHPLLVGQDDVLIWSHGWKSLEEMSYTNKIRGDPGRAALLPILPSITETPADHLSQRLSFSTRHAVTAFTHRESSACHTQPPRMLPPKISLPGVCTAAVSKYCVKYSDKAAHIRTDK